MISMAAPRSAAQLNRTTSTIIKASIDIHRALGPGLLENIYRVCLAYELAHLGLHAEEERTIPLIYKDAIIDCAYRADLDVESSVLVEVKALDTIASIHLRQVATYLRLADYRVGLLMNFGASVMKDGIYRLVNGFPRS
jgi:GxxExxY protein